MIHGVITKGVGGFYYVRTSDELIECRARGNFREENITPLVGDNVKIRISSEDNTGYIDQICKRETELSRPAVANITQAIIVMSIRDPNINFWLLDRIIVMAENEKLNIIICINKVDLNLDESIEIKKIYEDIGYKVLITSVKNNTGIKELKKYLDDNISVFAGPSGGGKSSLLNTINPEYNLETGKISAKSKGGKHTTRHTELLYLKEDSYVLDSPGFSSLDLNFINDERELKNYFIEINQHGENCKFQNCLHFNEPGCEVKRQVEIGNIAKKRYENYLSFLQEIVKNRRY
ncbi:MAG TPA: ribosome small subunit-dependent GTPase A [Tissierellaceae bacterium]|nr:ribosome small subunit-dependent GTPase A [Tissierellaceae bacterium]